MRDYVRREGLTNEDLLPEPIRLRKQLDSIDDDVAPLRTERAVRDHVAELNRQIRRARIAPAGLPILVRTADPERIVERWLANRPVRPSPAPPGHPRPGAAVGVVPIQHPPEVGRSALVWRP